MAISNTVNNKCDNDARPKERVKGLPKEIKHGSTKDAAALISASGAQT